MRGLAPCGSIWFLFDVSKCPSPCVTRAYSGVCVFWNILEQRTMSNIKKTLWGVRRCFAFVFRRIPDSVLGTFTEKKPSSSVMNAPIKQSPRIKTRPHIIEINYSIFSPIRKSSICSKPSFIKCLSSCLAGRFCFPFGDCCPCFRSQPSSYIYNIYI